MSFKMKKSIEYVDVKKMNEILSLYRDHPDRVIYGEKPVGIPTGHNCYIEITKTELIVTCCFYKTCTYILKLDGSERLDNITGMEAYKTMCQYAKPQHIEDYGYDLKDLGTCSGILYENMKFQGKRVQAWSYDINSAFSAQMTQPLPDLATGRRNDIIGENEVGFILQPDFALGAPKWLLVPIFTPGVKAEYVFKLMESPYKRFVEVWFDRKKCAKNAQEKAKAKMVLNASIGYLQRINPFWRSCIIHRCNKYVEGLRDENTIYSNTDCIVSAVRRPDLEMLLGEGLGQFKLEHPGEEFAWSPKSMIYQWNKEVPVARGVPKEWFKVRSEQLGREFDILTDDIPFGLNRYTFDKNTLMVMEVIYENYNK